jgi:predicted nucleic acid-binding protein
MAYLADTNVMWRRFDPADPRYPEIKAALDKLLLAGEIVYITAQNLIEYQALATRPTDANGLGLTRAEANAKALVMECFYPLLPENAAIYPLWRGLMNTHEANGKAVHDARLVAVMLSHGVNHILTTNVAHFRRFAEIIVVAPKYL